MSEDQTDKNKAVVSPVIAPSFTSKLTGFYKHRPLHIIGTGLLVVLILAVSIFTLKPKPAVCGPQVLKDARHAIDMRRYDALRNLSIEIRKDSTYKNDVNCQYVVTKSYIADSKLDESRTSLSTLTKLYDAKKGYSSYLGPNTDTPEKMNTELKYLEKQYAEIVKNMFRYSGKQR